MSATAGSRPVRRAIPDPQRAPIAPVVPGWRAITPDQQRPEAIRRRFLQPPAWTPEILDGRYRPNEPPPRAAAVLVPLVERGEHLSVLLTVRAAHLSAHAGQIAFPGGRVDPEDGSVAEAALREAEEEVGLARSAVTLLGQLPAYTTGTGFVVTPVVGWVPSPPAYVYDPVEVAEVFEVPLAFLLDPAHHQERLWTWEDGVQRSFLAMPWQRPEDGREFFIWGVTAAILRNFYRFMAA